MKRLYRFSLVAVILTFTTLVAHGQPPEISKEEFRKRERLAGSKFGDVAYRERMTRKLNPSTASKESGALVSQISEFVPPDRRRLVTVYQTEAGTRKEETILIGDRKFVRKDDGPWQDITRGEQNRYSIYGDPVEQTETATYRHLGNERIKDIEAEVLEEIVYLEYKVEGGRGGHGYANRLWITKDGFLLKREWKNSGSNGLVTSHTIYEYEYDPSIKISAPLK